MVVKHEMRSREEARAAAALDSRKHWKRLVYIPTLTLQGRPEIFIADKKSGQLLKFWSAARLICHVVEGIHADGIERALVLCCFHNIFHPIRSPRVATELWRWFARFRATPCAQRFSEGPGRRHNGYFRLQLTCADKQPAGAYVITSDISCHIL